MTAYLINHLRQPGVLHRAQSGSVDRRFGSTQRERGSRLSVVHDGRVPARQRDRRARSRQRAHLPELACRPFPISSILTTSI
jgi:hypothetical protein